LIIYDALYWVFVVDIVNIMLTKSDTKHSIKVSYQAQDSFEYKEAQKEISKLQMKIEEKLHIVEQSLKILELKLLQVSNTVSSENY
jgi:uncharacterized membrane protein